MNIAIIEDEKESVINIKNHLIRYSNEHKISFSYSIYNNGMEFISQYQPVWDLIILDIEMPLMDGIQSAKRIREIDQSVILVFMTKMAQYAMNGYEVNAFDYVLKPVNYHIFSIKMKKIIDVLKTKQDKYIIVQGKDFIRKISLKQILYIDVFGHKISYHTLNEVISSTGSTSIQSLENELGSYGFVRSSRCDLVNLHYVDSIEKNDIILNDGQTLIMSRNRKRIFVQSLLDYWGK